MNGLISPSGLFSPSDLISLDKEFMISPFSGFGWRWKSRGEEQFRVLTIEGNCDSIEGESESNGKNGFIYPIQLYSTVSDFANGITNTHFNWRYMKVNNGNTYPVITIEDIQQQNTNLTYQVQPSQIKWWKGETEPFNFKTFNWRFIKRDGTNFRVVTLE